MKFLINYASMQNIYIYLIKSECSYEICVKIINKKKFNIHDKWLNIHIFQC